MRDLIERARVLAEKSRLTPHQVALKCGVSQRWAYMLLRGELTNPSYKSLCAVIEKLGRKWKVSTGVE